MAIPADKSYDNDFFSGKTLTMTTTTKQQNFHNFTSIPALTLNWGSRKYLRCVKDPSEFSSPSNSNSNDDIKAVREKLIVDFRQEVQNMQASFLNGDKYSPAVESCQWNLRTRAVPNSNINGNNDGNFSPARNYDGKTTAKNGYVNGDGIEKGRRAKFAVSLSKQEIENDFLEMTGVRPARRPKKRAKAVQKQIDEISPGFWLTEITAAMYKVNE